VLDGFAWSWVIRLSRLEQVKDVLCAARRPKSQEMVIRIGEGPAAPNGYEARVPNLRKVRSPVLWQAAAMADRPVAAAPTGRVEIPRAVDRLAGGDDIEPVWVNELGGVTFRLAKDRYVKWVAAAGSQIDLAAEAERLGWAGPFTPVPRVLDPGSDGDGEWLLLAALPGRSAVHPRWLAEPETASRAVGEALRAMHDALPVDSCPFSWSVEKRTAELDSARHSRLSPTPGIDRLVVCHGDPCTRRADHSSQFGNRDARTHVADAEARQCSG
jgi:kanamycin kinase